MNFIDLQAQQRVIRKSIERRVSAVFDHCRFINGPEVAELEERLAKYTGTSYAVGCASGTDALLMSLMAYGIGSGDAVYTPSFTFIATAEVIKLLGATPVFVDIEADTFNIDVQKLEEAVEATVRRNGLQPRGIIPVDLFGQPADYDEINQLAKRYDLFVLEDAAQSFGARCRQKKACSLSEVAAASFFPAKPLGCYGDGGMIFTDDQSLYDTLLSIRSHGKGTHKYDNVRLGLNGRLDTLQAAILLAKLEIFDREIELRQSVATRYTEGLKDICTVPHVKEHNLSAWAQYSIRHDQRDAIMSQLKDKGIPTAIYYPKPLHLQDAFSDLKYDEGDFPVSEHVSHTVFSLPMHPYLTPEDQDRVIDAVREAVTSKVN